MRPDKDNIVYYDSERFQFYIIEWIETGNNDIPKRHYLSSERIVFSKPKNGS